MRTSIEKWQNGEVEMCGGRRHGRYQVRSRQYCHFAVVGEFRHGKRHGLWETKAKNWKITELGYYHEGKRHGWWYIAKPEWYNDMVELTYIPQDDGTKKELYKFYLMKVDGTKIKLVKYDHGKVINDNEKFINWCFGDLAPMVLRYTGRRKEKEIMDRIWRLMRQGCFLHDVVTNWFEPKSSWMRLDVCSTIMQLYQKPKLDIIIINF